jgi:phosphoesterase RecJ-like protein
MQKFNQEFNTLNYVIKGSKDILLFAHSHPDGDTVGANLALKEYILKLGKNAHIACFDSFPKYLHPLSSEQFFNPEYMDMSKYDLIIACDSVERGFQKVLSRFNEKQVIALLDHHPDIAMHKDINIVDSKYSSVCEIVYDFFEFNKITITPKMATYLLMGILGDTGSLQHSSTTSRLMEIVSALLKQGAQLSKIVETTFTHKSIATLRLWG